MAEVPWAVQIPVIFLAGIGIGAIFTEIEKWRRGHR